MRILHLPSNIASQTSVTVRALRDIGVEARGLAVGNARICDNTGVDVHEHVSRRRHPVRGMLQTVAICKALARSMQWAEIIHWHYGASVVPLELDLKYAAWLGKPRLVEFWGSDIRIPEVASQDNAYYARFCGAHPELIPNGKHTSRRVQERFSRYGFECLIPGCGELRTYVQTDLFPTPYYTMQQLILSDFEPRYPDPGNVTPLVVHMPSHKAKKGTDTVLRVVEELQKTHRFDFKLIHGVRRADALAIVRRCDIFLDQFVTGDHGLATLEAMALGKPAFCYIKPSLLPKYPSDLPIVNANQDNLAEVLRAFLEDGQRRHDIGRRSRAYVEKHHDAHKIARQLVGIYEELLEKNRSRRRRECP